MRVRIPIIGYLAGWLSGAVLLVAGGVLTSTNPLEIGSAIPVVLLAASLGGGIAAPAAVPLIVLSERKLIGDWWLFFLAGCAIGLVMIGLASNLDGTLHTKGAVLIMGGTISASMIYWLYAWHRNPPVPHVDPIVKVFE